MIEIINRKTGFSGYIDGDKYLDMHMQVMGYLEANRYKWKSGETLLILDPEGRILFQDNEPAGTLLNGKIYDTHNSLLYVFLRDKKQVIDHQGKIALELLGDLTSFGDREYFGVVSHFLELFA